MGVRNVLVYCRDHHCSHSTTMSAERWSDEVRLSDVFRVHHLWSPRRRDPARLLAAADGHWLT